MNIRSTLLLLLLLACGSTPAQERPEWHRQATNFIAKGDHRRALALLDKTLVAQPDLAPAHLLRGYALLGLQRPGEARQAYRRALGPGTTGDAYAGIATAELRLGRPAAALDAASKSLTAGNTSAQVYRVGAVALGRLARPLAALSWWRHICRLEPGKPDNFRNLGAALLSAGRAGEAAAVANEAIRTFGSRPELLRLKAGACIELGRDGEAADLLRVLYTLGRATPKETAALGDLHLRLGNPARAIEFYKKAGQGGADDPAGRRRLALAYWHAGDLIHAEKLLTSVISNAGPTDLVELGDLRAALDKHAPALECYQRALKHRPGLAAALLGVGRVRLATRRFAEANTAWRTLLSMGKLRLQARLGLARTLEEQGFLRRSLAQLRRARSETPGNSRVLGEILRLERRLAGTDNRND